ncbi:NAD(P)H-hydrate dehydratase [Lampropedia puyangensis]|uniref:Bifunctional NAD(P)H-hydrate repair enzyme n=2 Tax=Lampropedia puyangensis TaxID=1330072 RepID=A0A4S8FB29_9BURK|nr:NAD(P)H-hydrate dehydratase [Lampropedia puyangensis]
MTQADQACIAAGVAGTVLMQRAGQAVALAMMRRWQPCRVAVLCGPGNNGGDGFIIAQSLRDKGWSVAVFLLQAPQQLRADAAWALQQWQGPIDDAASFDAAEWDLVVDAIFGAGLNRTVDGQALQWIAQCDAAGVPVCAVDMPSGIDGANGQVMGRALRAELTVSFFRAKPGHYLLPGRAYCGALVLADIGIPSDVAPVVECRTWLNTPALWQAVWPQAQALDHKYKRGHVLVLGGALLTGAARLSAQAAQRIGSGLVTIAAPELVWGLYAQTMQGCMVQAFSTGQELRQMLQEGRRNVCLIGPGAGVQSLTRDAVLNAAVAGKHLVLDADALTVFADAPETLFTALAARDAETVLTPHEGEFTRLFGMGGDADKCLRAQRAAQRAGAVLVFKGADTVIAAPDGRTAINANAPATLATGGSGDVLAGITAGLLAQGMPAFEAACAAVWMHGEAANTLGPHLIADDLLGAIAHLPLAFLSEN